MDNDTSRKTELDRIRSEIIVDEGIRQAYRAIALLIHRENDDGYPERARGYADWFWGDEDIVWTSSPTGTDAYRRRCGL